MSNNQVNMNPFRGGLISKIRLFSLPFLVILIFLLVFLLSSEVSWRRNLLGISFLSYYLFVTLFGMLRVNTSIDDILGDKEDVMPLSTQMQMVRHSVRVYFSLWITGGIAILAGLFVAMNKPRWDMPVPLPAFQILSSVMWAILTSLYLHYLTFIRAYQFRQFSKVNLYFLRSGMIYLFLVFLFPMYFILYAGNGKIMNIPYLIVFTLPTNILILYLLFRAKNSIQGGLSDLTHLFFHKDIVVSGKKILWLFAITFILIVVLFVDYARQRKILWTYAARENHVFLFRPLGLLGIGLATKDEHGFTPLFWAVHGNADDFVKYSLENGSEIDAVNEFGQTPVIVAVLSQNLSILKLLSDKGANLNYIETTEGHTPLMLASRDGNLEIVKFLLEKKVNPEIKNKKGKSALDLAKQNGHEAIVFLLQ